MTEQQDGWVFVDDETNEEVGYAEENECRDADDAMQQFSREYDSHFGVFYRHNGQLNSCSAENVPEDFWTEEELEN